MSDIRDLMKPVGPCPRCGSKRVVRGEIYAGEAVGFTPRATRAHSFGTTVSFDTQRVHGCSECGLLWAEISTVELRDRLTSAGTPEAQRWIEERPDRPI